MLKLISWNIDYRQGGFDLCVSRSGDARDVLNTIKEEDADFIAIQETKLPAGGPAKKHKEALAEYFPGYQVEWVSAQPPARKGYAGTMILCREGLKAEKSIPRIGAPGPMDDEGRLLVLESENY